MKSVLLLVFCSTAHLAAMDHAKYAADLIVQAKSTIGRLHNESNINNPMSEQCNALLVLKGSLQTHALVNNDAQTRQASLNQIAIIDSTLAIYEKIKTRREATQAMMSAFAVWKRKDPTLQALQPTINAETNEACMQVNPETDWPDTEADVYIPGALNAKEKKIK